MQTSEVIWSLGVDALGNVFVYDKGNSYTRMIDTKGI